MRIQIHLTPEEFTSFKEKIADVVRRYESWKSLGKPRELEELLNQTFQSGIEYQKDKKEGYGLITLNSK